MTSFGDLGPTPRNVVLGCFIFAGAAIFALLILAIWGGDTFCRIVRVQGLCNPQSGNSAPHGGNVGPGTVTYRGSDSSGDIPRLAAADFATGDAPTVVSGIFSIGDTLSLNAPSSHADGTEFSLIYGDYATSGDSLQVGFSRLDGSEGLGLNVYTGDWISTYLGEGCSWVVTVTDSNVSGHISCTNIPASNQADGSSGSINLELDFDADYVPVSEGSGGPGG